MATALQVAVVTFSGRQAGRIADHGAGLHDDDGLTGGIVELDAGVSYLLAFSQVLVDICHWPPALSQSAFVLNCEKSVDVPPLVEGLAEGEVPGLELPELPEPPLGAFSEVPDVLPEPLPLVP